jgi:hypothetical protein
MLAKFSRVTARAFHASAVSVSARHARARARGLERAAPANRPRVKM